MPNKLAIGDISTFSEQIKIVIKSPELMKKIIEFKTIYANTENIKVKKYRKSLNDFWNEFLETGIDIELLKTKEESLVKILGQAIKVGNNNFYKIYEERIDKLFLKTFSELELISKLLNTLLNSLSLTNTLSPLLTEKGLIKEMFTELPVAFSEIGKQISNKYVQILEELKSKRLTNLDDYKINLLSNQLINVENEIDWVENSEILSYFDFSKLKTREAKLKAKTILEWLIAEEKQNTIKNK